MRTPSPCHIRWLPPCPISPPLNHSLANPVAYTSVHIPKGSQMPRSVKTQ